MPSLFTLAALRRATVNVKNYLTFSNVIHCWYRTTSLNNNNGFLSFHRLSKSLAPWTNWCWPFCYPMILRSLPSKKQLCIQCTHLNLPTMLQVCLTTANFFSGSAAKLNTAPLPKGNNIEYKYFLSSASQHYHWLHYLWHPNVGIYHWCLILI